MPPARSRRPAGSVPFVPGGIEVDGKTVFTSDHALRMEWLPQWIAIIGSGYIGLEFSDVSSCWDARAGDTLGATHRARSGNAPPALPALPGGGLHCAKRLSRRVAGICQPCQQACVHTANRCAQAPPPSQVYTALGSEVTFVEAMPNIMPGFDREIAKLAQRLLIQSRPIDFHTNVIASKVTPGEAQHGGRVSAREGPGRGPDPRSACTPCFCPGLLWVRLPHPAPSTLVNRKRRCQLSTWTDACPAPVPRCARREARQDRAHRLHHQGGG